MKTSYQLWGLPPAAPDWDAFPTRVSRLLKARPAQALICGLGAPEGVYLRIREAAREYGAALYLWLPLFAEMDGLCAFDPLIDDHGSAYLSPKKDGSGFKFRCPSSERNAKAMLSAFEPLLEHGGWDGVFLDRLRYPSFQYGLSGISGCFCPECKKQYIEAGLDPAAMREACRRLAARAASHAGNPLGLLGFDGSRWRVEDEKLQSLLDARCSSITRATGKARSFFNSRGLKLGLDLFTPALGYFAGQDFASLVPLADFVKPMLYLRTNAPAGLPYELDALNRALGGRGAEAALRGLNAETPEELMRAEVQSMARVKREHGFNADILCGAEYCRVEPITLTTPETIRHDVAALARAGAEGVMGSWSLLAAPEENAMAFAEAAGG